MGDLFQKIQTDLRTAMKDRDQTRLGTLRLLKSDLQYEMNRDGSDDLADEAVETVIRRNIKKRKEAMDQFTKAGRAEQAESEQAELRVLEDYLPPAVTEAEIVKVLDEVWSKVQPSGPGDMGKVMGPVMGHFKGQNIDGNVVRTLVQQRLQG